MFERLDEELEWVAEDDINPCYWVDDWVIFPDMDESKVVRLIHQENENGSTPISELQKWSPEIRPTHRLTWVLLWGLPLSVWEEECMAKVLAEAGEVIEVDENVEVRRRLDVARILVWMQLKPSFQVTIPATVDGVECVLQVVEDMTNLGGSKQMPCNPSWLPPSPFSTQPNTPVTGGVLHPKVFSGDGFPDGASDDTFGGDSEDPDGFLPHNPRRDQWVKTLARSCRDWSVNPDDVEAFHRDTVQNSQDIGTEMALTASNGHLPRNGSALNGDEESDKQDIMFKEKFSVIDSLVDQAHLTYGLEEIQYRSEKGVAGDKVDVMPREEITPHVSNVRDKDNGTASQLFSEKVAEEMGLPNGPTSSVNKGYVRRKTVLKSKTKAQWGEDSIVDCISDHNALPLPLLQEKTNSIPGPKDDPSNSQSEDPIHMQYALLKEMGLSCGEDDSKVKGMLLDMENKDVMLTAERGAKNHNYDNSVL